MNEPVNFSDPKYVGRKVRASDGSLWEIILVTEKSRRVYAYEIGSGNHAWFGDFNGSHPKLVELMPEPKPIAVLPALRSASETRARC